MVQKAVTLLGFVTALLITMTGMIALHPEKASADFNTQPPCDGTNAAICGNATVPVAIPPVCVQMFPDELKYNGVVAESFPAGLKYLNQQVCQAYADLYAKYTPGKCSANQGFGDEPQKGITGLNPSFAENLDKAMQQPAFAGVKIVSAYRTGDTQDTCIADDVSNSSHIHGCAVDLSIPLNTCGPVCKFIQQNQAQLGIQDRAANSGCSLGSTPNECEHIEPTGSLTQGPLFQCKQTTPFSGTTPPTLPSGSGGPNYVVKSPPNPQSGNSSSSGGGDYGGGNTTSKVTNCNSSGGLFGGLFGGSSNCSSGGSSSGLSSMMQMMMGMQLGQGLGSALGGLFSGSSASTPAAPAALPSAAVSTPVASTISATPSNTSTSESAIDQLLAQLGTISSTPAPSTTTPVTVETTGATGTMTEVSMPLATSTATSATVSFSFGIGSASVSTSTIVVGTGADQTSITQSLLNGIFDAMSSFGNYILQLFGFAPSPSTSDTVQGQDITLGTGPAAQPGDTVSVLYAGYVGQIASSTLFDSSAVDGGVPLTFTLGTTTILSGFQIGINGMQVGGERLLTVPPSLAYGDQAITDPSTGAVIIPASSTLIFDVTLVDLQEASTTATTTTTQ